MKINIVIDSLTLEGQFDNHDSESIIAAFQSNLSQLVKGNESQFSQSALKRTERITAFETPIKIRSNSDHDSIGAEIAQSIHDKIIT
jgi:hypothetical protein